MHPAQSRSISCHRLKIRRNPVTCRDHAARVAQSVNGTNPDDASLEQAAWKHGPVTYTPLPADEDDTHQPSADEQADDSGAVPSVVIPGPKL
jgi:hypothetical protein